MHKVLLKAGKLKAAILTGQSKATSLVEQIKDLETLPVECCWAIQNALSSLKSHVDKTGMSALLIQDIKTVKTTMADCTFDEGLRKFVLLKGASQSLDTEYKCLLSMHSAKQTARACKGEDLR